MILKNIYTKGRGMLMGKKFNVTGTCIPTKNYMVDISEKLKNITKLIEAEEYFIINRPRQYGKTTTLYMLEKTLEKNEEYLTVSISFEGVGDLIFEEEQNFSKEFLQIVADSLFMINEKLAEFLEEEKNKVNNFSDLSRSVTKFIMKSNKKVVLMIDEVDKSSNNQLFLSFLGMLRNKYLNRNAGKDYTFHSVILAGVHDVRSLRTKIRSDVEHKYNSPWNIATDFDLDMSFSTKEICTMLKDYENTIGISVDKEYYSKRLRYYTSGYPFLVSKLCKIIDEKLLESGETAWENEYMDIAVRELLKESNTNFDSLIKNLENNQGLYETVKKLLINGIRVDHNIYNPDISIGSLYGIFKNDNGRLSINNRIYEQLIYNYMVSKIQTSSSFENYNDRTVFIKQDGNLDIKKVFIKFKEFMKHEYSNKRKSFLEEDGRLIFLAFLSPIINGSGFAFKEVKGGDEKRFDIVITYEKKLYILELKIWRGEEYHKKGLIQLGEYLNQYSIDEGYLLIFDFRKSKETTEKIEEVVVKVGESEKRIMEVYC